MMAEISVGYNNIKMEEMEGKMDKTAENMADGKRKENSRRRGSLNNTFLIFRWLLWIGAWANNGTRDNTTVQKFNVSIHVKMDTTFQISM